ncbi:AP-3 complex subunit beta-2 isoform X2 [Leptidea sinapis]|nr:AP-3 complex subunit beta-2 isoform X2 [Leptidea sinapis]
MLDGSKDSLKLEAMKRIIGMIAKGRDASDLFPAVVKNVVSKNIEVKKLVYVYLVRYAEEQQDLALLSISTFQRALKDPNQLIRASALRVLSSIRVPMIVPIVMLAIRDSSSDMSPYVRKTAAHAIPKLYSLDPEQKEELVSIITKLLSDKAPLVVGSAAMAFSEVCGDRINLLHSSYRKLCGLLLDIDEWGQLALLNVLTVYARTCFPDPNHHDCSGESEGEKPFYDSDSDATDKGGRKRSRSPSVDPDLRLLLRVAKPLLQSRNAGVVMAVAQLYYHCGPVQELGPVAKSMVRLLRAPPEVQSVVLTCIASLTVTQRSIFEPFLKSFFVRNSDPTHIKLLKVEILTNLATESTAPVVLREYQTYVTASDKVFVAATIQAIGRLAVTIQAETETCLNGLLHLLSSKDENVVCEAVVVVKRVVGGAAQSAAAAVSRAAALLRSDRLAGAARAAAVWLVAEHGAHHPRAAAVLAHTLHTFADQEELVKLQLLSLAVKLSLTQPDTRPMCSYVLSLARYDASYDVRDRARLLRKFVEPSGSSVLASHATYIFCPDKPKPTIQSSFQYRGQFTLGSLSQYVGAAAAGYTALPAAPATAVPRPASPATEADPARDEQKNKNFYSEPGSESESGSTSSSSGSSDSEESSDEEEEKNSNDNEGLKTNKVNNYKSESATSRSGSDTESESESGSETENDSDEKESEVQSNPKPVDNNAKSNIELLLDLDFDDSDHKLALPTLTPTAGVALPTPVLGYGVDSGIADVGPSAPCSFASEVVSRAVWGGVSARASFPRTPHLRARSLLAVHLELTNHSARDVTGIRLNKKTLTGSRSIVEFPPVAVLGPGATTTVLLGVDFTDSIQPVEFTLLSSIGEVGVVISPPVGELMRSVTMSPERWDLEHRKLRGMTECKKKAPKLSDDVMMCLRVFETANLGPIDSSPPLLKFAGRMISSQELVLLSVQIGVEECTVVANCSNMAVASLLANEVANSFSKTY